MPAKTDQNMVLGCHIQNITNLNATRSSLLWLNRKLAALQQPRTANPAPMQHRRKS